MQYRDIENDKNKTIYRRLSKNLDKNAKAASGFTNGTMCPRKISKISKQRTSSSDGNKSQIGFVFANETTNNTTLSRINVPYFPIINDFQSQFVNTCLSSQSIYYCISVTTVYQNSVFW
jgi:hypothetical protein